MLRKNFLTRYERKERERERERERDRENNKSNEYLENEEKYMQKTDETRNHVIFIFLLPSFTSSPCKRSKYYTIYNYPEILLEFKKRDNS